MKADIRLGAMLDGGIVGFRREVVSIHLDAVRGLETVGLAGKNAN
jgi:hypothetical protein